MKASSQQTSQAINQASARSYPENPSPRPLSLSPVALGTTHPTLVPCPLTPLTPSLVLRVLPPDNSSFTRPLTHHSLVPCPSPLSPSSCDCPLVPPPDTLGPPPSSQMQPLIPCHPGPPLIVISLSLPAPRCCPSSRDRGQPGVEEGRRTGPVASGVAGLVRGRTSNGDIVV